MRARVYVTLKPGVLDPAGKAVQGALHTLGYGEVDGVRIGKYFEVDVQGDVDGAKARLEQMCEQLLANTVIEDYRVEIGRAHV